MLMKVDGTDLAIKLKSIPLALATLEQLEIEIRKAPTFGVLSDLTNVVAGLYRRWKPIKEVADRAGECWIEAEFRLGDELKKMGKAKGTRGSFRGKPKGVGSSGVPIVCSPDETPSRKELGISKRQYARALKLREIGREKRKQLESELRDEGKAVTPAGVFALVRKKNKTDKKHAIAAAAFSETGPFDCVVIDPPWEMQKIDRDERPNQDAFDYPVMSEENLERFWSQEIAHKLSNDCHVFCWTTQKFLPVALRLIEAWGLNYVLTMVWHKSGGFQPVELPQYNCEFIVYARKGAPVFIDTKEFFCCFEAPRRQHSRKPEFFYDLVRRVTGGSRIDVFSREQREGFAQYGNELEKFSEAAE